tara:strand:- start:48 stop:479 length:432 start_codon:yes stop_codon:yes gene_type:complete
MNFKEAKKHNRKLRNKYLNNEISYEEKEKQEIDLYDLVQNDLDSDEGLEKFFYMLFHLNNPKGARAMLPVSKDFTFTNHKGEKKYYWGTECLYSQHQNYHARELSRYLGKWKSVTWRDIKFHVNGIKKDFEAYKEWREEKEVA